MFVFLYSLPCQRLLIGSNAVLPFNLDKTKQIKPKWILNSRWEIKPKAYLMKVIKIISQLNFLNAWKWTGMLLN